MEARAHLGLFTLLTILTAALGCLQPGIDPVFLTLLSTAHPVAPSDHGWIVGATQAGMAIGSLIVWRAGPSLPRGAFPLAALIAFAASLATAHFGHTATLLAVRFLYGLAMGCIYIRAMSVAAVARPNAAYGAVFLVQLVMSTLTALLLPAISEAAAPLAALSALSLVPLLALVFILSIERLHPADSTPARQTLPDERHAIDAAAWALALASLAFICATMMVWSFTGALALAARISEPQIGRAVAIGSIAGAVTALCVMREKSVVPLPLTGLLCGLALLSPIAATASGRADFFLGSVILLNIGSTAIIIRCSGMAAARSRDSLFQRLVACTHSFGMILGPVMGSLLDSRFGATGLLGGAVMTLLTGCTALLAAAFWEHRPRSTSGDITGLDRESAARAQ